MTRTRVLVAAAVALLAIPTAAQAANGRAGLRVVTEKKTLVGDDGALVGATRSYLDSAGTARALPENTALGQLVAGTAAAGISVGIDYNEQFAQGFLSSIGGQPAAGGNAFWGFYVDNTLAQVGAEQQILHKGQEVVWVLDPDFNKPGPFYLDLDVVPSGHHRITFKVTRAGGAKPVPAKGATLIINGERFPVPASGRLAVDAQGDWTARATLKGAIRSELLSGTS
jgi:hypothetical protein